MTAPTEAPPAHRPSRWIRFSLLAGTALVVVAALVVGWLYFFQVPPGEQADMVRVQTYQQLRGGNPHVSLTHTSGAQTWTAAVEGMGQGSQIVDGQVDLVVSVARHEPLHREDYDIRGLDEGDTVLLGPVTIEVVRIYDAVFERNHAADLRIEFDESRFAEDPVSTDEVQIVGAGEAMPEPAPAAAEDPAPAPDATSEEHEMTSTLEITQGSQDSVGDHRIGVMAVGLKDDVPTARLLIDDEIHELEAQVPFTLEDGTVVRILEMELTVSEEQRGGVTLGITDPEQ